MGKFNTRMKNLCNPKPKSRKEEIPSNWGEHSRWMYNHYVSGGMSPDGARKMVKRDRYLFPKSHGIE